MNYIVKTKIHFLWIIYYVFNIAIKCVIYTFAFNFLQHLFQFTDIMKYIFVSSIGLFLIIRQGLYWRNFSLKFNTDILTLREGGIFVREKNIHFKDIEGYNEKANILEKLFKLSSLTLKLEKSSNESNITLPYIRKKYINEIKSYITSEIDYNLNEDYNYYYKLSFSQLLKGSMASLNILVFFTFFYSIYENLNTIFNFDSMFQSVKKLYLESITNIIIGTIILLFLILLFGILKNFIQFGSFKLIDDQNFIYTDWGVISRYDNAVDKREISAIKIHSTFWQKFFSINKISVVSLNSKSKNIENNIIFPFIEKSKIKKILKELFGLNLYDKSYYRLTKYSTFTKLFRTSWSWLFILPTLLYFFKGYWLIFVILIALVLFSQITQAFFNKYYYTNDLLIYKQSGVSFNEYIINFDNIEDLIVTQNLLQRIFAVCSVLIVIKDSPPKKIKLHDIYDKHAYNIAKIFRYHND